MAWHYQPNLFKILPKFNTEDLSFVVTTKTTRLISIVSKPIKAVVVVVIIVVVVVVVVVVVFVIVIIVGHKNLTLKFGQNLVNDKLYIVVVFSLF